MTAKFFRCQRPSLSRSSRSARNQSRHASPPWRPRASQWEYASLAISWCPGCRTSSAGETSGCVRLACNLPQEWPIGLMKTHYTSQRSSHGVFRPGMFQAGSERYHKEGASVMDSTILDLGEDLSGFLRSEEHT